MSKKSDSLEAEEKPRTLFQLGHLAVVLRRRSDGFYGHRVLSGGADLQTEVLQVQLVRLDPPDPQGPQQAAGPAAAADGQAGLRGQAGGPGRSSRSGWDLCSCSRRGTTGASALGAGVGLGSFVFHGGDDVLVGRQQGGALAQVAVAHRVVAAAHHFLVARHAEGSRVRGSAQRRPQVVREMRPRPTVMVAEPFSWFEPLV